MPACIVWFRQDLRLTDNPALLEAARSGLPIVPVFILDDENAGEWKHGGATRWWLHHSLTALDASLNNSLIVRKGRAEEILPKLIEDVGATSVYWNRCYEPWRIKRDKAIKEQLTTEVGITAESFNASLLWEPWQVHKEDKTPYKVFTPFFRRGCRNAGDPPHPAKKPAKLTLRKREEPFALPSLHLLPQKPFPRWDKKMEPYWQIGEAGAQQRLKDFLDENLKGYKEGRNYPVRPNVSRLSPYLHFGEISPRQVWHDSQAHALLHQYETDLDTFHTELGWREFSHALLYHFPHLPEKPLQERFNAFPWAENDKFLTCWQTGQTGYPIVDAGMRELWETGYMHNRVRMIVGSFLVKHLRLHWHHGEKWFWDCLVDADLANNSASWQWIAGCGADAAPYFRVFNPVTQGEKFDAAGIYVRRWCPELMKLPDSLVHKPWEAPPILLKEAGIRLGETYPAPIVDHKQARAEALSAFQETKGYAPDEGTENDDER